MASLRELIDKHGLNVPIKCKSLSAKQKPFKIIKDLGELAIIEYFDGLTTTVLTYCESTNDYYVEENMK